MHLLLLLACVFPIQEEQVPNPADRLSPTPLKRRVSYKIEAPKFLDDRFVVKSPEKVLAQLQSVQQQAWNELKTVKGRGWMNFIRKIPNDNGSVILLDFAILCSPFKTRELAYYQKKSLENAKNGTFNNVGGQDPDSKKDLICLTAIINTPDMTVVATGFEQGLDDFEVKAPENRSSGLLDFHCCLFQYKLTPKEFFETTLPEKKKRNYQVRVKAKDELVELAIFHPKHPEKPVERWLFDLSKNGGAVFSYNRGSIFETEFQKVGDHWLPRFVTKKTRNQYSETKFFDLVVNQDLNENEFAVRSLPARDERVEVNDRRTKKSIPIKDFNQ